MSRYSRDLSVKKEIYEIDWHRIINYLLSINEKIIHYACNQTKTDSILNFKQNNENKYIGPFEAISVPKGKGYATVTFERKSDAIRAIKTFDGVTLDGRPMRVTLSGPKEKKSPQDTALLSRALLFGGATGSVKSKASTSTKSNKGKKEKDTKKAPAKKEKKDVKKKEKKPAAKKEEKKPVKSEDLDADMDSYFASKAAKEE